MQPTTTTSSAHLEHGEFAGFPPEGLEFLRELADNNDVAWFDAHRAAYEKGLRDPAKALVVALGEALRERGLPDVYADPKVGRSLFRINRDTRFSADKTPYNAHLDIVLWQGSDPRQSPACMVRMTGSEVTTGAGVIHLRDNRLERFRHAVAEETSGRALQEVLAAIEADVPGVMIPTPSRKRVPGGFPQDHPRADLLRLDGLHTMTTESVPDEAIAGEFVDWIADRHVRFAPLLHWLTDHVEGDK